jgi:hypothetical protein
VLSLLNAQQTYFIAVVARVVTEANRTLPRSSWRPSTPGLSNLHLPLNQPSINKFGAT